MIIIFFFGNSNFIYIYNLFCLLLIQSILWSIRLLFGKIISSDSERPKTKLIRTFKLSRLFFWLCLMSILVWRIPWREEPGSLPSKGSQRVRHDWVTSLSLLLMTCRILVPQPGTEPRCLAVKVRCLEIGLLGKFPSYITLYITLLLTFINI